MALAARENKKNVMKKILTVKELISLLLELNMDASVYINVKGEPIGLAMSDIGWNGDGSDSAEGTNTRKSSTEIYFDVTNPEN